MDITAQQAAHAVSSGALLLDVREPYEFHAGHAPDATHLPLSQLPTAHRDLPRDRRIVVVCRSGNRSAVATQALRQLGYEAFNLQGGMQTWAATGLPVVQPDGAIGMVA